VLHVYDLAQSYLEYWRARLPTYSPFHTAIEVCGTEYSFAWNMFPGFAEISSNEPRSHPEHKFRLTLAMGYSAVPPREIVRMVSRMGDEWNNNTFNLHTRNNHNFSEILCGQLGAQPLPKWIHDNISTERVFLRVYNLGQTFITRWHNSLVKSYGAFHTGVEVYGREYCFGATQDDSSGVGWLPPGECEQHDFRESLYMGTTDCSKEQVEKIIIQLSIEWPGSSYDMLRRNCHNFSQALCGKLGVSQPPAWVNELASTLAGGEVKQAV